MNTITAIYLVGAFFAGYALGASWLARRMKGRRVVELEGGDLLVGPDWMMEAVSAAMEQRSKRRAQPALYPHVKTTPAGTDEPWHDWYGVRPTPPPLDPDRPVIDQLRERASDREAVERGIANRAAADEDVRRRSQQDRAVREAIENAEQAWNRYDEEASNDGND